MLPVFSLGTGADQVLVVCSYMLLEVLKGVVRTLRQPVQSRWMDVAWRNMAVRKERRGRQRVVWRESVKRIRQHFEAFVWTLFASTLA